ncbi:MAG TPA: SurA N-terminal domain-containing protein [Thermoleophilaceae bacterium]|nr:SurA N-terminal domain-containing protein [Thermoleophilaceae bacterium]
MTKLLRRPAATVALGLAIGLAGCSGGDDDEGGDGSRDVPADSVAVVGDRQISRDAFDDRLAAVRRSQSGSAGLSGQQLRQQAMTTLLQEAWLEREAEELGATVSDAEVRRRVGQARAQFPRRRAYRRFLGGQTERDLMFQIRVQLLGEAIEAKLREQGKSRRDVFRRLQTRWSGETACRDELKVPGCEG